jgi:hypothetical protein
MRVDFSIGHVWYFILNRIILDCWYILILMHLISSTERNSKLDHCLSLFHVTSSVLVILKLLYVCIW